LGSNISDQAYLQASLGLKVGGLGLRNPVKHASAGYIASVNKCASFVERLIRSQGAIDVFWHSVEDSLKLFNFIVLPDDKVSFSNLKSSSVSQFELSALIDKKDLSVLYE